MQEAAAGTDATNAEDNFIDTDNDGLSDEFEDSIKIKMMIVMQRLMQMAMVYQI